MGQQSRIHPRPSVWSRPGIGEALPGATTIAQWLGTSERVIGLTIAIDTAETRQRMRRYLRELDPPDLDDAAETYPVRAKAPAA